MNPAINNHYRFSEKENNLDKTLDAARSAHNTLIVTACVLLTFNLAPTHLDTYQGAIREIEFIETLNETDFVVYLRNDFLRASIIDYKNNVSGGDTMFREILGGFSVDVPLYCSYPSPESTISDWRRFANDEESHAGFFVASAKDIRYQLRHLTPPPKSDQHLASVTLLRASDSRTSIRKCNGPIDTALTGLLDITVRSYKTTQVDNVTTTETDSFFYPHQIAISPLNHAGALFEYFIRWLRAQKSSTSESFPSRPYLSESQKIPELADKTLPQALFFLNSKVIAGRKQVSILGIGVDPELVAWVAPAFFILLLAYLLAHAFHIRQLQKSPDECRALSTHPWIAVHRYWYSNILTLASLSLPPFAAGLVALKEWPNLKFPWFYVVMFLALLILSLACSFMLTVIKRTIHRSAN
jgi:hypothetical protein